MAKEKIITGVLVDTTKPHNEIGKYDFHQAAESNLNLQRIYDMLKCDVIDVATRKFGEHYYDIYVDDEGLFKSNPIVAVATFHEGDNVEQLVGNVFICKHDGKGGMQSLNEHELAEVMRVIVAYRDANGELRHALGATLY